MSLGGGFFGGGAFGAPAFGPDQVINLGSTSSGTYSGSTYAASGSGQGVTSGEGFGQPAVIGAITIVMQGGASAQALGQPKINVTVPLAGASSAETLGNPTVVRGTVTVQLGSSSTAEAFGQPGITATLTVLLAGGSSAETGGNPTISLGAVAVSIAGVSSGEAAGLPTVVQAAVVLLVASSSTAEAFGQPTITSVGLITPQGAASSAAVGQPVVTGPPPLGGPYNDNLADAAILDGTEGTISGDTLDGSTYETGEPNIYNGDPDTLELYGVNASTWYVWHADDFGELAINCFGSTDPDGLSPYGYLVLYAADSPTPDFGDLEYIGYSDSFTASNGMYVATGGFEGVPVEAGRYYFLQVQAGDSSAEGLSIVVNWSTTSTIPGLPPRPPEPPGPGSEIGVVIGNIGINGVYVVRACKLTDSLFGLIYQGYDQVMHAVLAWTTGNPTEPIAFGTSIVVHSPSDVQDMSICTIDSGRFLITYTDPTAAECHAVVASVAGEAVSLGTSRLVSVTKTTISGHPLGQVAFASGIALTTTRAVVVWYDWYANNYAVTVLIIAGTTLSISGESRLDYSEDLSTGIDMDNLRRGNYVPAGGMSFWCRYTGLDADTRNRLMSLLTVTDAGDVTVTLGPRTPMDDINNSFFGLMGYAIDPTTGFLVVPYYDMRFSGAPDYYVGLAFIDPDNPTVLTTIPSVAPAGRASGPFSAFTVDDAGVAMGSSMAGQAGTEFFAGFPSAFRLEAYNLPPARAAEGISPTTYARYEDATPSGRYFESWDIPVFGLGAGRFVVFTAQAVGGAIDH